MKYQKKSFGYFRQPKLIFKDNKAFKRIPGYENFYACNDGFIYRYYNNSFIPKKYSAINGIHRVSFTKNGIKKSYRVEKLIAEAFGLVDDDNIAIIHKDKSLSNNQLANLKIIKKIDYNKNFRVYELEKLEEQFFIKYDYIKDKEKISEYFKLKNSSLRVKINWLKVNLKL